MAVEKLLIFSILHLLAIFFIQYCEFIFESFGDGDFFILVDENAFGSVGF